MPGGEGSAHLAGHTMAPETPVVPVRFAQPGPLIMTWMLFTAAPLSYIKLHQHRTPAKHFFSGRFRGFILRSLSNAPFNPDESPGPTSICFHDRISESGWKTIFNTLEYLSHLFPILSHVRICFNVHVSSAGRPQAPEIHQIGSLSWTRQFPTKVRCRCQRHASPFGLTIRWPNSTGSTPGLRLEEKTGLEAASDRTGNVSWVVTCLILFYIDTSSTTHGGVGSFKDRTL